MPRIQRLVLAAATLTAISCMADAGFAATAPASPRVVQTLLDCRKVADNTDRLACYDKAAASLESATANGDLVTIDREQRRAARRQAFGFTLPSLSFLEHGEKTEDTRRVEATVTDVNRDGLGDWVVTLDDGAVWRQVEPVELGRRPHKGSKAIITRGALGGFFMTIDGEGAGKAKRES